LVERAREVGQTSLAPLPKGGENGKKAIERIVTALFSLTWPRGQGRLVGPPLPLYQKEEKTGRRLSRKNKKPRESRLWVAAFS
jgi:hypothetical protein